MLPRSATELGFVWVGSGVDQECFQTCIWIHLFLDVFSWGFLWFMHTRDMIVFSSSSFSVPLIAHTPRNSRDEYALPPNAGIGWGTGGGRPVTEEGGGEGEWPAMTLSCRFFLSTWSLSPLTSLSLNHSLGWVRFLCSQTS